MLDQAAELRKLVRRTATAAAAGRVAPSCVAVCGAAPGVGATSAAVALARHLAGFGATWLLDAGPGAAATRQCLPEASPPAGLFDVLTARLDLAGSLRPAADDLRIAAGVERWELDDSQWRRGAERLVRQLQTADCQYAVLDAGHQASPLTRRLCQQGGWLLVVATPAADHVLSGYALIKSIAGGIAHETADDTGPSPRLLVNRAGESQAAEVHRRLDESCRCFLAQQVALLGFVPDGAEEARWGPLHSWAQRLAAQRSELPQGKPPDTS